MTHHEHPVCGRCGVHRHLHPTKDCTKSRRSYWLDEHSPWRHLAVRAWVRLPFAVRWWVAEQLRDHAGRHWCDLVDSVLKADPDHGWDDYVHPRYGDLCDFPLPTDVGKPPTDPCYCNNVPFTTDVKGREAA